MIVVVIMMTILMTVTTVVRVMKELKMRMEVVVVVVMVVMSMMNMVQQDSRRGEICHCRHCWQQCKIFPSGVNISIFTHFLVFVSPKLLKFSEIKGVKFLA